MSKKFSIIKEIDLSKLNKEIDTFINETRETNPYLFMNNDTFDAIYKSSSSIFKAPNIIEDCVNQIRNSNKVIGVYQGFVIYRNDILSYGEVEIR